MEKTRGSCSMYVAVIKRAKGVVIVIVISVDDDLSRM